MISVESRVHVAAGNVRQKEYCFKGNLLDYIAYEFPKDITFSIDDMTETVVKRRVADAVKRIYLYIRKTRRLAVWDIRKY